MNTPDMPEVAHLNARTNSVDLDALASGPLDTWITYSGINVGDYVYINWRGLKEDGSVDDIFGEVEVDVLDAQQRWRFGVEFNRVSKLRGGTVFYSFRPPDGSGGYLEESKRRHFYIHRMADGLWTLPVAHLQGAHDLIIDVTQLKDEGLQLATPPYVSMAEGDKVFLVWEPYYDEFAPGEPIELLHAVSNADLGRPLLWHLERGDVENYIYGFGILRYRIEYADGSVSRSPEQVFDISWPDPSDPPATPLLAAPSIPGHVGDTLDPDGDAYKDGIWLLAEPYPDLHLGDSLMLYVEGPEASLRSVRADVSSLDSQHLAFHLDRAWLQSEVNRGKQITFSYEYGRPRAQKRSEGLTVALQRPLNLPLPVINDAVPEWDDEPHQGTVHPRNLDGGAQVRIPADAELGEGEVPAPQVSLHWEGHGSTGSVIVPQPVSGDRRLFRVPRTAIAANMGRRLEVYYTVTRTGESPRTSQKFDLKVADYGQQSYPLIQVAGVENEQLSLGIVPSGGALCSLGSWPFMAEGQLLGIEAEGEPRSRKSAKHTLRPRSTEVSEDEYYDGLVEAHLPKAFLEGLQLNRKFRLTVSASFDGGETWRNFRSVDIELIA